MDKEIRYKNDPYPWLTATCNAKLDIGRPGWVKPIPLKLLSGVTREKPWTLGHTLYLIQEKEGEFVKVGHAAHPVRRLDSLQSGNPRPLAICQLYLGRRHHCVATETRVLQKFSDKRFREWILADPEEIAEFIGTVGNG